MKGRVECEGGGGGGGGGREAGENHNTMTVQRVNRSDRVMFTAKYSLNNEHLWEQSDTK